MSKIRDEASKTSQSLVGKNRFINGNMAIWQRGNTVTAPASALYFGADRFFFLAIGTTMTAALQDNIANTGPAITGQRVAMKLTSGGAPSTVLVGQRIEGSNCNDFVGRKVTFSAWVYSDVALSGLTYNAISTQTQDNWSGSTTSMSAGTFPAIPAATWTKVSFTFTGTTECPKGVAVEIRGFDISAGRAFYTTGWQMELGEIATDFEYRSYGDILNDCQRYFLKMGGIGKYRAGSTGFSTEAFPFSTRMRINPAVSNLLSGGSARIRVSDGPTYSTSFSTFATQNEIGVTRTDPSVDGNYIAFDEVTLNAELL